MKKYSRLRAVIDLDAVMYNMEMMHANIEKGTKMVVVIKTDGYGHGAVPISRMLEDVDYVWGYAVATLDEGVVLRKAGIQKPILCLGCIFPDQLEEMIRHEIRMTTYSYELAKLADETAYRMGKKAYLHIKIDTGMSRLGFPVAKESVEEILKIGRLVYFKISISDLRNKFPEIETLVNSGNPVYLIKNGYGAMVVLSLEEYASLTDNIEMKLDEADRQAAGTDERLSHESVFKNARSAIHGK